MRETIRTVKPKVVISSYDDIENPFYSGGGARSISEVASRLSSFFDVTVITGNYPGAEALTLSGVRYKRIGPAYLGPRISQLLFHLLLPFYVKTQTFDIWIESFTPPFSTSCLQLYTKKPVIGLIHMLSAEDMMRKYKLPFYLLENRGLKTYRHFIALTENTKRKINRINPKATISLIPNGVSATNLHPIQKGRKENYILYIGRIEFGQKGLDLLLDAYASIEEKGNTRLIIAGSGSHRDEQALAKKIRQCGLESRVKTTGRVEGRQKEKLLQGCRLVVVPSRLETFSVVTLEAMSFAKPVVSFDITGLQWIPSACVLKAKAFDAHDLGEKMSQVLADSELRSTMSAAAKKAVKEYSWENVADLYRKAIEEVLN